MVVFRQGIRRCLTGQAESCTLTWAAPKAFGVGDYFRVFRYQGTHIDTLYQVRDMGLQGIRFLEVPL